MLNKKMLPDNKNIVFYDSKRNHYFELIIDNVDDFDNVVVLIKGKRRYKHELYKY